MAAPAAAPCPACLSPATARLEVSSCASIGSSAGSGTLAFASDFSAGPANTSPFAVKRGPISCSPERKISPRSHEARLLFLRS